MANQCRQRMLMEHQRGTPPHFTARRDFYHCQTHEKIELGEHKISYIQREIKVTAPLFCDRIPSITVCHQSRRELSREPPEGVERKSPVSQGKRGKQELGSPRRSRPRTLDSSQSGTRAPPKKPVTQAASVPNGTGNGTLHLQRGKEIVFS